MNFVIFVVMFYFDTKKYWTRIQLFSIFIGIEFQNIIVALYWTPLDFKIPLKRGRRVNLFWNNETTLNIEIFVSPLFHSNWRCVQNILDAMHWFPILIFSYDWKWGSKDYRFEKFNPLLLPLIVIFIGRGL